MYNINNHYTNIFNLITSYVHDPTIFYLHPFGTTEIKNIERMAKVSDHIQREDLVFTDKKSRQGDGCPDLLILCYDQEPLLYNYNKELFSHIKRITPKYWQTNPSLILLNTEKDSDDLDKLTAEFNYVSCYYFFHIFAAQDWFREYYYNKMITKPSTRKLSKKFITMNRLTSDARVYRTLLVNELIRHDTVFQGHISYSRDCPIGGDYQTQLMQNAERFKIPEYLVNETIQNISNTSHKFRIDYEDEIYIPNRSFSIDFPNKFTESFVHIVTETNYWGRRKHLTEKIFKPIVLKQPFILVGCAHNLEYLRSYGFKTFSPWWSEDYDTIENDIDRMHRIGEIISNICKRSLNELQDLLCEMEEVLEYNYNLFYSREFVNFAWKELGDNLSEAVINVRDMYY